MLRPDYPVTICLTTSIALSPVAAMELSSFDFSWSPKFKIISLRYYSFSVKKYSIFKDAPEYYLFPQISFAKGRRGLDFERRPMSGQWVPGGTKGTHFFLRKKSINSFFRDIDSGLHYILKWPLHYFAQWIHHWSWFNFCIHIFTYVLKTYIHFSYLDLAFQ